MGQFGDSLGMFRGWLTKQAMPGMHATWPTAFFLADVEHLLLFCFAQHARGMAFGGFFSLFLSTALVSPCGAPIERLSTISFILGLQYFVVLLCPACTRHGLLFSLLLSTFCSNHPQTIPKPSPNHHQTVTQHPQDPALPPPGYARHDTSDY